MLGAALAAFTFARGYAALGYAGFEVRDQMVVGAELRLVIETYRRYTPWLSHSSKTGDAKGYLVTVDLSSTKPLAQRAKVYGPLWDIADPRSSVGFQTGAIFTQADLDVAQATTTCVFDTDGTLLRFSVDAKRRVTVRDAFVPAAGAGSWTRQGDVKRIDDRTEPMSEDRVETPSGRFALIYQGGAAKLYDLFTGEAQDDPWITASFAHARSIPTLENLSTFVTEDRNHLVVSPMAIWNRDGRIFETFDLDGKTMKRSEVGLAYSRPEAKPTLFARKLDDPGNWRSEAPNGAVAIGKDLYLFAYEDTSLRLYRPDSSLEFRAQSDGGPAWPIHNVRSMRHRPESSELVLFVTGELDASTIETMPVTVVRWSYRTGAIARDDVRVKDLFEPRGDQLRPKSAIAVK